MAKPICVLGFPPNRAYQTKVLSAHEYTTDRGTCELSSVFLNPSEGGMLGCELASVVRSACGLRAWSCGGTRGTRRCRLVWLGASERSGAASWYRLRLACLGGGGVRGTHPQLACCTRGGKSTERSRLVLPLAGVVLGCELASVQGPLAGDVLGCEGGIATINPPCGGRACRALRLPGSVAASFPGAEARVLGCLGWQMDYRWLGFGSGWSRLCEINPPEYEPSLASHHRHQMRLGEMLKCQ